MENLNERIRKVLEFTGETLEEKIPFLELKEGEYEFIMSGEYGMFVPMIMIKVKDTIYNTCIPLEWLTDQERNMNDAKFHERVLKALEYSGKSIKDICPDPELIEQDFVFYRPINPAKPLIVIKFKDGRCVESSLTYQWFVDTEKEMNK